MYRARCRRHPAAFEGTATHCDIKGDRAFYFTTCGWMMWNWLVTFLASDHGNYYDGSPSYPGPEVLFDYATTWGSTSSASAKFIDALGNAGLKPMDTHDLSSIHTHPDRLAFGA